MKYKVMLSDQAVVDVNDIYEYLAFEKLVPDIAGALIGRIEAHILKLDEMPYRYRAFELEPWKSRGLRMMPVENFLVLYIPNDENRTVTVVRVFYSRQNTVEQLQKTVY